MNKSTLDLHLIRERRLKLKISLQEMAINLGFKHASTYLQYENGIYNFKANHLPLLVKLLNFKSIDELFFEEEFAILAK